MDFSMAAQPVEPTTGPAFTLGEKAVAEDGVIRYTLKSRCQSGSPSLRILLPDKFPQSDTRIAAESCRFLFVLPVESGDGREFGDGLSAVKNLNLHNIHKMVVIAPTFGQIPWYGDHPTDADARQESHMVKAVAPAVDRLFPSSSPRRLLLGFSKSGWGAVSLLIRHPDLFDAAAAWDAPLMVESPTRYGMEQVFATQKNFDGYFLPKQLREKAAVLQGSKRLALLGYGNFRDQMRMAHDLLLQLGVPHDYADGPRRRHHWNSGWVPEAVESLVKMTSLPAPSFVEKTRE
jgi:hypothetical protein